MTEEEILKDVTCIKEVRKADNNKLLIEIEKEECSRVYGTKEQDNVLRQIYKQIFSETKYELTIEPKNSILIFENLIPLPPFPHTLVQFFAYTYLAKTLKQLAPNLNIIFFIYVYLLSENKVKCLGIDCTSKYLEMLRGMIEDLIGNQIRVVVMPLLFGSTPIENALYDLIFNKNYIDKGKEIELKPLICRNVKNLRELIEVCFKETDYIQLIQNLEYEVDKFYGLLPVYFDETRVLSNYRFILLSILVPLIFSYIEKPENVNVNIYLVLLSYTYREAFIYYMLKTFLNNHSNSENINLFIIPTKTLYSLPFYEKFRNNIKNSLSQVINDIVQTSNNQCIYIFSSTLIGLFAAHAKYLYLKGFQLSESDSFVKSLPESLVYSTKQFLEFVYPFVNKLAKQSRYRFGWLLDAYFKYLKEIITPLDYTSFNKDCDGLMIDVKLKLVKYPTVYGSHIVPLYSYTIKREKGRKAEKEKHPLIQQTNPYEQLIDELQYFHELYSAELLQQRQVTDCKNLTAPRKGALYKAILYAEYSGGYSLYENLELELSGNSVRLIFLNTARFQALREVKQ